MMCFALDAESHVVLGGRDRGRAGAGEDDPDVANVLADDTRCALSSAAPEMIAVPCWSS